MSWTVRRRVQWAGVMCVVAGWLLLQGWQSVIESVRTASQLCLSGTDGAWCRTGPAVLWVTTHPSLLIWSALVLVIAVAAPVLQVVARWCLAPLRQLAEPVALVSATSLGHRLQAGDDPDLKVLGEAVDAMLERVAAGYAAQRRFAANASHELRTPLSVQRTLIEVGMSSDATPDQLALLSRQLLATNERNERLIEGLVVLAESDQGLASRTPQRLDRIAADVMAAHADRAADGGVTMITELVPCSVLGEEVLLERLVVNLVANAIKYNRPGGVVRLRVDDQAALRVENTGPAVPAERIEEMFEPFRRLSSDRTDHSGGSGLGLTIARSITAAHGGTMSAEPRGADGLRVTVTLPTAELVEALQEGATS